MRHYIFILAFLLTFSTLGVTAQETESKVFQQIKVDTLKKKLDKLLIVGIGSTASRIFLERLGEKLVDKFKDKVLKVEYRYMGKDLLEAKRIFDTLNNKEFDAFLIFTPKDTSSFGTVGTLNNAFIPSILIGSNTNSRDRTYSVKYHQDFYVRLYHVFDKRNSVWAGLIKADCDLASNTIYKHVSKLIINCFKKNKYL